MKNNKKGSAMVEASLVFPIIILLIIAYIYLLINMYINIEEQSLMHKEMIFKNASKNLLSEYMNKIDIIKEFEK